MAAARYCCSKPVPPIATLDPHSDRLREDDVPPGLQLVLQDRARSGHERARDLLAARAHTRRIERDQRPHLHPRPARGLRWLGREGNPGWSYDDVLPYFRKLEHNVRGANEWHGADGPLWASDIGAKHELIEALIAAGARSAYRATTTSTAQRRKGSAITS
jgi:hypothetical protein